MALTDAEKTRRYRERHKERLRSEREHRTPEEISKHREQQRAASARYRARNLEKVRQGGREYMRRWRTDNPDEARSREQAYVERYGRRAVNLSRNARLPIVEAVELVAAIPSECEICSDVKELVYDHDHSTSSHRGWLCGDCNLGLGRFKDAPARLRAAANYLERTAA